MKIFIEKQSNKLFLYDEEWKVMFSVDETLEWWSVHPHWFPTKWTIREGLYGLEEINELTFLIKVGKTANEVYEKAVTMSYNFGISVIE